MLTTFASGSISTSFVFLRPIVVLSDRMQLIRYMVLCFESTSLIVVRYPSYKKKSREVGWIGWRFDSEFWLFFVHVAPRLGCVLCVCMFVCCYQS